MTATCTQVLPGILPSRGFGWAKELPVACSIILERLACNETPEVTRISSFKASWHWLCHIVASLSEQSFL